MRVPAVPYLPTADDKTLSILFSRDDLAGQDAFHVSPPTNEFAAATWSGLVNIVAREGCGVYSI